MLKRMSGAEAVVAGLSRWGVERVFGLPGVHLDPFFDALHGVQNKMGIIHTRHEQGAAYMALGAAMATGKPAAFAVVPGPGLLNATAALATAYACSAPVLCLTSTVIWPLLDRHYGSLHELPDQPGILQRLTKWSARAEHASQIPDLIDEAFRQMLSGRPRPVALEIPPEIFAQRVPMTARDQADRPAPLAADPDLIAKAADLIAAAKHPLIVVGGGAHHASAEVRALAEVLQAPVISRQMGKGILADDHPLSIAAYAANDPLWPKADVVIGIGTRLQHLREWGTDADLKVIRIDLDPRELTRIEPPAVGLVADSAQATKSLVDALRGRKTAAQPWIELADIKAAFRKKLEGDIGGQLAYLDALRQAMPREAVLVDEITQVGHVTKVGMPFFAPRTLITSGYQGTLGYGYATALGAQAALPDRPVVSINGDGGFLYTMSELATAALHNIPLVAVVFNDKAFGNVRVIQQRWYGGRTIATNLHNPDFVSLAKSFGVDASLARGPEELAKQLRTAIAARRPALIEVPVTIEEMGWPWSLILPRKVRGGGATGSH